MFCWPLHKDLNQQWEFAPLGAGYSLRCVFTNDLYSYCDNETDVDVNYDSSYGPDGNITSNESKKKYLKYLIPSPDGGLRHSAPLVTSAFPVAWEVERVGTDFPAPFSSERNREEEGDVVRIRWHGGFVVDLSNWGNGKAGTRIELAREQSPVHKCQLWKLVECGRRPVPVRKVSSTQIGSGIDGKELEASQNGTANVKAADTDTTRNASTTTARETIATTFTGPTPSIPITCHTTTSTSATSSSSTTLARGTTAGQVRSVQSVAPIPSNLKSKSRVPELGYTICSMCRRITSEADAELEDELGVGKLGTALTSTSGTPAFGSAVDIHLQGGDDAGVKGTEGGRLTPPGQEREQKPIEEEDPGLGNGITNMKGSNSAQTEWDLLSDTDESSVTAPENDNSTEGFYSEAEEAQEVAKDSSISGQVLGLWTGNDVEATKTTSKVEVEDPVVDVKADEDGGCTVTTTTRTITTTVTVTRVQCAE
ncbi:hypothetical protein D9758_004386 [Tetrapyrgos nigripes]|uniref:Uncharacterized protein n=1 Tax=Tetrapyrgos nigripes TaxID=182062 RepID=A0A8H5LS69_9AGAR|nr:hypothetical protein D9758_004386 [Tetrapyrgos nigripes]